MRTGGYFLNYFDNDINAEFHRRVTGPAIVKATGGELDAIVVGVGSGGTITGVGEYVKAWYPDVRIIAVEPAESQALTGGVVGRAQHPGHWRGLCAGKLQPLYCGWRGGRAVGARRCSGAGGAAHRRRAGGSLGRRRAVRHAQPCAERAVHPRVLGVFSGAQAVE